LVYGRNVFDGWYATKDVPKDIQEAFRKKLDDPFFEIDFERWKRSKGL
jgi:hypothetical protein